MGNKKNTLRKKSLKKIKKRNIFAVKKRMMTPELHDDSQYNQSDSQSQIVDDSLLIEKDNRNEDNSVYRVEGRRLVNITYFWEQIKKIKHLPFFSCDISNCIIVNESTKGYISSFTVKCNMCSATSKLDTDDHTQQLDLNMMSVLGTVAVGNGYSQLEEFTSILNMPHLNKVQYQYCHDNLEKLVGNALLQEMIKAGEEEVKIATEKGDVGPDGIPYITVISDGAWSKRSYKTNYNALSGVAVIIGEATKKILHLGIKNKFCVMCFRYENINEPVPSHSCARNWKSTSTAMESAIILEGFKNSVQVHGLKYLKLVGDGDSSITKKIAEGKPYGAACVEKIECVNHLLRNFCNKLKDLCKAIRSTSSSKLVPQRLRKKLQGSILRFRVAIKKSALYRSEMNIGMGQKILLFKKDVLNCIDHIFGNHSNCEEYYCSGVKKSEENLIPALVECGLKQDILNCLQRVLAHSSSFLMHKNNNAAELFNSIINKFVGGKRINFSFKASYQLRCQLAAISYNNKEEYLNNLISSSGSTVGHFTKTFIIRRTLRRKRVKINKKRNHRQKVAICSPDEDYGAVEEYLSEEEIKSRRNKLENILRKTSTEKDNIEEITRGQSANPLWFQHRQFRLTASNFGKICKMKQTTNPTKLAKTILCNKFQGNSATRYGQENEIIAIRDFEELTGLTVNSCGLFVGEGDDYFLGASPDGLINDETDTAILEIKCPKKLRKMSVLQGVAEKQITFLKMDKNNMPTLKITHDYYYQIQGQLHITNRKYCYFVVWSPVGPLHIEKLEKDDEFWASQMYPQLCSFYNNVLIPEIIKINL